MPIDKEQFKRVVKDDWKDRIQTELFDTKQTQHFPQVKIMRWDNEVNYSIRYKETDTETPTIVEENGKVKWCKSKHEVHLYEKPISKEHPEGAHEIELVLKEKPATNKFEFTIETKNLDFFYQAELTVQEIADGLIRPENVIDSYAVYYKNCPANYVGGKEYKAGKAFHIYRINATDANGNWVWGTQNIDVANKLHTVEIPQEFLDNAVYPVVVDPTFGYTGIGSSGQISNIDLLGTCKFALAESGGVTSMSIYHIKGGSSGTHNIKALIYNDNSNYPGALNTNGGATSVNADNSGWKDLTITASLSSGNYWLGWVHDYSYNIVYDTGGNANQTRYKVVSGGYSTPPNPAPASMTGQSFLISIYATYTASGGATVVQDIISNNGFIVFPR